MSVKMMIYVNCDNAMALPAGCFVYSLEVRNG